MLAEDVLPRIERLKRKGKTAEIAFFGGTFTGLPTDYMTALLDKAQILIAQSGGVLTGVRCSTRPDFITADIVRLFRDYGGTAIELGAQSMDTDVLRLSRRGHTAEDVFTAAHIIKESGLELGLQMMTGLPSDTREKCISTAQDFIRGGTDTVRIYPTVVMRGTVLADMEYTGFTFAETVSICADLLGLFAENGVRVIRVGLNASPDVRDNMVGGNYADALGEIVLSEYYYRRIVAAFDVLGGTVFDIKIPRTSASVLRGQRGSNMARFKGNGISVRITEDNTVTNFAEITRLNITE
jgi:histone acetyltransferase (RNA polymerase elongator complex component)